MLAFVQLAGVLNEQLLQPKGHALFIQPEVPREAFLGLVRQLNCVVRTLPPSVARLCHSSPSSFRDTCSRPRAQACPGGGRRGRGRSPPLLSVAFPRKPKPASETPPWTLLCVPFIRTDSLATLVCKGFWGSEYMQRTLAFIWGPRLEYGPPGQHVGPLTRERVGGAASESAINSAVSAEVTSACGPITALSSTRSNRHT